MAIVWADPFNFYDTADIGGVYDANVGGAITKTGGKRDGGYIGFAGDGDYYIEKSIPATGSAIVQFSFRAIRSGSYSAGIHVVFYSGGTRVATLQCRNKNSRTSAGAVYADGSASAAETVVDQHDGFWHYFEVKFIHGASGLLQLRDGKDVTASFIGDYQAAAETTFDAVRVFIDGSGSGGTPVDIAHLVILDLDVGPLTDYIGPQDVVLIKPKSDVAANATPSTGTDHYAVVDDDDFSTTDYLDTGGASELELFGASEDFSLYLDEVNAVIPYVYAGLTVGGTAVDLNPAFRIGAVDYESTAFEAITDTAPELRTRAVHVNPATLSKWTQSELESLTFGWKTGT